MKQEKIKYKLIVGIDGEAEIVGPKDEPLEEVTEKEYDNVVLSNIKTATIIEHNLRNPRIVCYGNRCWYVY